MEILNKENLIGVGRTAEVYRWGQEKVLKLFFNWCHPDMVETEFNIISSIQKFKIPLANAFEIIKIGNRLGIIYERIPGESLLEELISNTVDIKTIGSLLAEYQYNFHRFTAKNLRPLHDRLSETIEKTDISAKCKHKALNLLDNLPPGDSLLHMDYHPGQILRSKQGVFIIDWGTSCKGNPLADVACTIILLRIADIHSPKVVSQNQLGFLRKSLSNSYLKFYRAIQDKFSKEELEKWILIIAISRLNEGISGESEQLNCIIHEQFEKVGLSPKERR